jgi:hypothetical protein
MILGQFFQRVDEHDLVQYNVLKKHIESTTNGCDRPVKYAAIHSWWLEGESKVYQRDFR